MFLSDKKIKELCNKDNPLIENFIPDEIKYWNIENEHGGLDRVSCVSFGLSQNGYDIRIADKLELFTTDNQDTYLRALDPKRAYLSNKVRKDIRPIKMGNSEILVIPPRSLVLGHSKEKFNIPDNITGFLYCKSSYARLGMNMAPTVLKSGWSGQLVLEIYNQTDFPLIVYPNEGIGTIYFAEHDSNTTNPYQGKYQNQTGIVGAK